ncbi:MAG: hypothetical protein ABIH23_32585 [bacterium]
MYAIIRKGPKLALKPVMSVKSREQKNVLFTFPYRLQAQAKYEELKREMRANPGYRKTPKSKRFANITPGMLQGWSKDKPQQSRMKILTRLVNQDEYDVVIKRLNQIANVTWDISTVKKMRSDMWKLKKKYRPKAADARLKREFDAVTKRMIRQKKARKTAKSAQAKRKGTRKNACGKTGSVKINVPESSMKSVSSLADTIADKTGWSLSYSLKCAREVLGRKRG